MADGDTPIVTDEQLDKLKEAVKLGVDLKKLNEELNELTDKQLESLKEMADLDETIKTSATSILSTREKSLKTIRDQKQQIEDMLTLYEKGEKSADRTLLIEGQRLRLYEAELQELKKRHEVDKSTVENYEEEIRRLETKIAKQKLSVEKAEEFHTTIQDSIDAAKSMGSAIGAAGQVFQSNFTKHAGEFVKIFQGGTLAAGQLMKTMATGLGTAAINNMAGLVVQLVDMESGFRKATGASAGMARSVTEVYEATRLYGVSAQEASAATQALFTTFTDFTMLGSANQEMLAGTAAVLGELGVANADFAKGIQISTKALGMSTAAAEYTQRELVTFAKDLGVAPQQMAADFANAGDMMAKMGDQGVQAFKDLAHVSKITGMEVQKLLNITNKFDTFEGAAEQAGKLNAALGGNFVNAMDLMMETDPAARFNMIRDSILDAGLSFDDMSYYQKNFYKDALGLSDVGDLAMMLSGNMDNLGGTTNQTADDLIALKQNAAAVQSVQEQFNAAIAASVPVLTPMMNLLKSILNLFAEYTWMMPLLITGVTTYTVAMKALAFWNAVGAVAQAGFGKAALATSIAMGVLAVAAGLLYWTFFVRKSSPTFYFGLGLLTGLMRSFGNSVRNAGRKLVKAAPAFMAIGTGVALMGAGMGFAAQGVADLAAAFTGLGENAGYAALGIGLLMAPFIAFIALAAALVTGPQAVVAAGIVAFIVDVGAGAMMLGLGMMFAAKGFAEFVTALGSSLTVLPTIVESIEAMTKISALDTLVLQFERLAQAIDDIPAMKAIAVAMTMDSLAKMVTVPDLEGRMVAVSDGMTQMATVAPQVGEAVEQIHDANMVKTAMSTVIMSTALGKIVQQVQAPAGGAAAPASTPVIKQPIIIQLDRHKVGKAVIEVFNEKGREANGL